MDYSCRMSMVSCPVYVDLYEMGEWILAGAERERESTGVPLIDRSYCTLHRIGINRLSDSSPADGSGLVDLYIG